jgi:hypothetical protein
LTFNPGWPGWDARPSEVQPIGLTARRMKEYKYYNMPWAVDLLQKCSGRRFGFVFYKHMVRTQPRMAVPRTSWTGLRGAGHACGSSPVQPWPDGAQCPAIAATMRADMMAEPPGIARRRWC